jgi:lipoprotein-releasing system permease protein
VTLVAPRGAVTPFGTTPRIKTYRVAGTFKIGMSEYDMTFVFMPLKEAQLFFGHGDTADGILVMVEDPIRIDEWRLQIGRAAGPTVLVTDWRQLNQSFFGALAVERNVMFLILTLIILVAALNIISGLIMLVKDKGGDIAILRTMGATQGAVMRIFFIAGASIGVLGTFAGLLLGIAFCANIENIRLFLSRVTGTTLFDPTIYFLSQMPSKIEPADVISVVFLSLALSFFATLYPSWRAARLDPVEALRYE